MLILAIDTMGAACAAAIFDGTILRSRVELDLGRGHAERVVELCESAMRDADAEWGDLTHVAAGVGPGSFTGIRAGVAAARGFALALGVRSIGVTAFEAIAHGDARQAHSEDGRTARHGGRALLVALDARRGQLYAQLCTGSGTARLETPSGLGTAILSGNDAAHGYGWAEPMIAAPDDLARMLPPGPLRVVGSGARAAADALRAHGRDVALDPSHDRHPDVGDIAAIAGAKATGEAVPPASPLYLRAADAVAAAPVVSFANGDGGRTGTGKHEVADAR